MASPKKALVVRSPHSGRSAQLEQALTALREAGIEVTEVISIAELDGREPQGKQWQEQGIEVAIAAGGDGLVGGVISHITSSTLPLGILPLGTANDVARSVGIPIDVVGASQVIAQGNEMQLDLGVAQPAEQAPHPDRSVTDNSISIPPWKNTYFAHALTVGVNVEFARLATDPQFRQQYKQWTYPYAVIEAVRNYKAIEVELTFGGLAMRETPTADAHIASQPMKLHTKVAQVTVVNTPVFWGSLQAMVPGVQLSDSLLDIVVIEDAGLEALLLRVARFFGNTQQIPGHNSEWHAQYGELQKAELTDIAGLHHFQVQAITIQTVQGPLDATLDGEVRGQTPVYAHVANERVRLFVPQK